MLGGLEMNLTELRQLATEANKRGTVNCQGYVDFKEEHYAFFKAANPAAMLELLDRLEAAEIVCEVVETYFEMLGQIPTQTSMRQLGIVELAVTEWQKQREAKPV